MIYKFNRKKVSLYLAIALALMIIVSVASFSFNGNKAVFAYNEVGGQEEAIESLQNESVQRGGRGHCRLDCRW